MKKSGSKQSILKSSGAATVAEMILSLITLPLGLGYITGESGAENSAVEQRVLLCMVFFVMTLTRLLRARRLRMAGKPKLKVFVQWFYALAFLACSILPVLVGYTLDVGLQTTETLTGGYMGDVRQLIALIFWSALCIGRILSIVRNHEWRRTVVNVILAVLTAVCGLITFIGCDVTIAMIVIVILALGSIFSVVFGRIRVDVLRTIIRETYASEILLGLLLLICAFAYVLRYVEPGIPTFQDGLWYCFAIVTTIGFGDFAAVTTVGRILSVILGIYGIVVVAMITSIIVNFYGETKKDSQTPQEPET